MSESDPNYLEFQAHLGLQRNPERRGSGYVDHYRWCDILAESRRFRGRVYRRRSSTIVRYDYS